MAFKLKYEAIEADLSGLLELVIIPTDHTCALS